MGDFVEMQQAKIEPYLAIGDCDKVPCGTFTDACRSSLGLDTLGAGVDHFAKSQTALEVSKTIAFSDVS